MALGFSEQRTIITLAQVAVVAAQVDHAHALVGNGFESEILIGVKLPDRLDSRAVPSLPAYPQR